MDKHAREYFAKICRKNGDVKSARRYEEGLYNSLGAINMDVLDNLLAEVQRLREENDIIEWAKKTHHVWLDNVKEGYRRHKEAKMNEIKE